MKFGCVSGMDALALIPCCVRCMAQTGWLKSLYAVAWADASRQTVFSVKSLHCFACPNTTDKLVPGNFGYYIYFIYLIGFDLFDWLSAVLSLPDTIVPACAVLPLSGKSTRRLQGLACSELAAA